MAMFAAWRPSSDWRRTPAGRRATSLALALAVHLLLLLLLLRLSPPITKKPPPGGPTTIFTVPAPTAQTAARASRSRQKRQATARAARAAQPRPVQLPTPHPTIVQPWVLNPDLAGFSLHSGPEHPAPQVADRSDAAAEEAGGGPSGGGGKVVGHRPGGEPVYVAEWVREPTPAEMRPYWPTHPQSGWGEIECRTVARFKVEDCEELGQSPAGSGISRAAREASWQFLVRPPRVGAKFQVGTWVRIHYEVTIIDRPDH